MKTDWDTTEQNSSFEEYVVETADHHDGRRRHHTGTYGYDEAEWEAFQHGWNAAKKHFKVVEEA